MSVRRFPGADPPTSPVETGGYDGTKSAGPVPILPPQFPGHNPAFSQAPQAQPGCDGAGAARRPPSDAARATGSHATRGQRADGWHPQVLRWWEYGTQPRANRWPEIIRFVGYDPRLADPKDLAAD